jgi:phosphatidylglycerol lysyltransferase
MPGKMRLKKNILNIILPIIGIIAFFIALVVLYNELKNYHIRSFRLYLASFPSQKIFFASCLTILSYLILTGYDFLAFLYIKNRMDYRKIAFVSSVSYIFSNNIGFSSFSGSAVRFRLYSSLGLTTVDIVKIITFCLTTFWLGFIFSLGIVFTVEPVRIPELLHLPFDTVLPFGIILILFVVAYISVSFFIKNPLKFKNWEFNLPHPGVVIPQTVVSLFDWVITSSVLYVLLPDSLNINFVQYFSIFMIAQMAGLISHVPGGIGVFETTMLLVFQGQGMQVEIFSTLLVFRMIYYVIPFILGIISFIIYELINIKDNARKFFVNIGKFFPEIFPVFLSAMIFIAGVVLIFSGASPSMQLRMEWLDYIFPIHVIEISHFLGSIIGMGLLILSYGIFKRLDTAYYLTIILVPLGAVFSILKGFDYEEAIILTVILAAFIPCHKYFYRKTKLTTGAFSPFWFLAIIVVVGCALWIGFFYYKHVDYRNELWWQFEFSNNASRFLRSSLGIILFILIFFLWRLFRPSPPRPRLPSKDEIELARNIAVNSRNPQSSLAMLGDKMFLFNEKKTAFLMYGISGSSWISMGDPVGEVHDVVELIWQFKELAYKFGGTPAFYEISDEFLNFYIELGFTFFKFGEEAVVDLESFGIEGKKNSDFRYAINKFTKNGYSFEIIPKENIGSYASELKVISDTWLKDKKTREKKFSLGCFKDGYLKNFDHAVVKKDGRIIAFSNIFDTIHKEEMTIDLMRYSTDAPNGIMDYLFINIIMYAKQSGYRNFNLGISPLSGLSYSSIAPMWNRIGNLVFQFGESFYNFQGLRNYKEKFGPTWHPRYIAVLGGFYLPFVLKDISSLISGNLIGVISK